MKKSTLFLAVLTLLVSCKPSATNKKSVSVTMQPMRFLVEQLAGPEVEVISVLSPGDNPHTFEPTPMQMASLSKSALFFANTHYPFEEEFVNVFKAGNPTGAVIDCSQGIDLLEGSCDHDSHEEHNHGKDPHYWVLPTNAAQMVQTISKALIENNIASADSVNARVLRLNQKLNEFDVQMKAMADTAKRKMFIVFHPTLDYIARAYGLEQLAIEKNGKEPVMAELQSLVENAKANAIKYVLVQKQFDQKNAEVIAKETGGTVLFINPLGYNYFDETKTIIDQLNKALNE